METFKLNAQIDEHGTLRIEVPTNLPPQTAEVVVVLQPIDENNTDPNGWPIGFFEKTYGSLADDPIERPEQPPLTERDPIE